MSDRLSRQVAVELQQLDELLETHRSLMDKCMTEAPDVTECSALAAVLHGGRGSGL